MHLPFLELHPLSLIRAPWKHRWMILVAWIACSAGGFLVVSRMPDIYRAQSLILVDSQKIPERFVASTVQVALQDHLATVSQQVLSATELQKVVERYNLYPDARKARGVEAAIDQMRKDLGIELEKGWAGGRPGAFRVLFEGQDPVMAAAVVNQISGLFIRENLKARELRAAGTSEFIDSQLRDARKSLEEQEANYTKFRMQRMGELPQQESAILAGLSRLQAELQSNRDTMNRAEQNRLTLENTLRVAESSEASVRRAIEQAKIAPRPGANPAAGVVVDPGTPQPKTSEQLAAQLAAARTRYHDEHPEIRRLREELAVVQQQELLATEETDRRRKAAEQVAAKKAAEIQSQQAAESRTTPESLLTDLARERERVAAIKLQLSLVEKEWQRATAEKDRITRSIADQQARLEKVPVREQEMQAVTRDYENSKQNYKSLLDKKMSADMAIEMERRQQGERFTLQDPARVPTAPVKPKRALMYLACSVIGLVIGFVGAFGTELQRNRILGEWELPADVPVLARIPSIDQSRERGKRTWFGRRWSPAA